MNEHKLLCSILQIARHKTDDGHEHWRALNDLKYAVGCRSPRLDHLRPLAEKLRGLAKEHNKRGFILALETAVVEAVEKEDNAPPKT